MAEYTVASIETNYKGRQYRSRLEARWASFFDVCKWSFEYEPCDLGSWSPDFLLRGHTSQILVEIKPIVAFDKETGRKMARATKQANFHGDLLLLGLGLFNNTEGWDGLACGWLCEAEDGGSFGEATIGLTESSVVDFSHATGSYRGRMTGEYDGNAVCGYEEVIKRKWAEASNAVQWKSPRKPQNMPKGGDETWRAFRYRGGRSSRNG